MPVRPSHLAPVKKKSRPKTGRSNTDVERHSQVICHASHLSNIDDRDIEYIGLTASKEAIELDGDNLSSQLLQIDRIQYVESILPRWPA